MHLGLVGAFAAAVCYGVGSVLQSVGARRATASRGVDVRLFGRLARQAPYVAGLSVDLVGFAASVYALRTLPLFLVQAAVAASIGVTALVAAQWLGLRLSRPEVGTLIGLGAGLILLALAARPEHVSPLPVAGRFALLAGTAVVVGIGVAAARLPARRGAAALAVAGGLAYAGVGVAARVLAVPHSVLGFFQEPVAYALVLYGLLANLLYATALQRGAVTTTTAVLLAVETVVPSGVGLAALGDTARQGFAPVAAAGFVVTLGCALGLARYGELAAPAKAPG